MKAERLTEGRENWAACRCTAELPTQQPSVLSCFQAVARVAVGLMLYNITSDEKDKAETVLIFYWPDAKSWINMGFPLVLGRGGGVNQNRRRGEHHQSIPFIGSLTSSELRLANDLCLMSVCWRSLPTFFSNLKEPGQIAVCNKPQRPAGCWCLGGEIVQKEPGCA